MVKNMEEVYRELTDGRTIKIVSKNNVTIGADVFFDEIPAPDGDYIYKSLTHRLIVRNGKIVERFTGQNGQWTNPENGKVFSFSEPNIPIEKMVALTEEKFDKQIIPIIKILGIIVSTIFGLSEFMNNPLGGIVNLLIGIGFTFLFMYIFEGFSTIIKLLRKISDK